MPAKQDPEVIARKFADQMQAAFGPQLESLLLVGSAARGDFQPGKSDVNTLVVLSTAGMEQLEKAYPLLQSWKNRGLALPHFMTRQSLERSVDSYPLEILDFKSFHRLLVGADCLSGLQIPPEPLRVQIEREARGKLFLLRQVWAAQAGHDRELSEVMRQALKAFTVIFQGILTLKEQPIPADRTQLFDKAAQIAGFSAPIFRRIHELRLGHKEQKPHDLFKALLHEVTGIVAWVDGYKG
jgi:predicted nucleotidyltransferase